MSVYVPAFITWLKTKYAQFLAYLGRGGSDNEG